MKDEKYDPYAHEEELDETGLQEKHVRKQNRMLNIRPNAEFML